MPRLAIDRNPTYRRHRASGQAVVTLSGVDRYLGPHGSKASRDEYDRVVGEWLANGRRHAAADDLTVAELIARFWTHASTYYRRPDGTPTGEAKKFAMALAPVARLYGGTEAAEFGPLAMQAVQGEMVRLGWCRNVVNAQVRRVRMAFRWATAQQLVPASTLHGLAAVSPLKAGRTTARERDPVRPVAVAAVDQTLPHLTPTVAAMVRLQLLTGARPGEVCALTTASVDRSGDVWTATLTDHKNAHRGHVRTLHLGPQAQAVLTPFLSLADPTALVFSPAASTRDRQLRMAAARTTPLSCGNRAGTNVVKRPRRRPGDRFDVASYRRAIARACDAAFPPPDPLAQLERETVAAWRQRLTPDQRAALAKWHAAHRWHPHQRRHTRATDVRKRFGVEAAQHILGHATLDATQLYAERNAEGARAVALAVG